MLPVLLNGKVKYVNFSDEHNGATVTDEKMQDAIEKSSYFKSGKINLFEQTGEKAQPKKAEKPKKEFPEVTGIQEAIEILKGEPYLVDSQLLKTPEDVKRQAEANSVGFPNLKQ
jgi:hypothetical protein